MAGHETRLFLVSKENTWSTKYFVFRTREAQRKFTKEQNAKVKTGPRYYNVPSHATWGPDN